LGQSSLKSKKLASLDGKLLLDCDFSERMRLCIKSDEIFSKFIKQLELDSNFLSSINIMDYSLLIGIIHVDNFDEIELVEKENEFPFYKPFFESDKGGIQCEKFILGEHQNQKCLIYVSLIDVLQDWNLKKKAERFIKTKIKKKDSYGISAVPPLLYKKRFQDRVLNLRFGPFSLISGAE
jgi:1-phosphatidylinositol-4-phosphate 5-kinase